jgi:hypothetical protein
MVKGDLIIEDSGRIMTRSRAKLSMLAYHGILRPVKLTLLFQTPIDTLSSPRRSRS